MKKQKQNKSKLEKIKRIKSLRHEQLKRRCVTGLVVAVVAVMMASVFVVPVSQLQRSVLSLFGVHDSDVASKSEVILEQSSDGYSLNIGAEDSTRC